MKCPHCGSTPPSPNDAHATFGGALCSRCGAMIAQPKKPILLGSRYRLERTVGVGSMGVVHLAEDLRSRRKVAVKHVAPELVGDADAAYRFERETSALAAVRHRNVVRVLGMGDDHIGPFVVMEYVRGPSLEEIVAELGRRGEWLDVRRALAIVGSLAEALGAVHASGFIHRDVKPSNVLIEDETDRPVLLDFGLARTPARASAKSIGAGTPWYMAPEQVDHEDAMSLDISARTDVYALGCTAFEVLTSSPPFESCDLEVLRDQQLHETPPPASSRRPELRPLDRVLARALAKDPGERFSTPSALAEALDEAWTGRTVDGPSAPGDAEMAPVALVSAEDTDTTLRVSQAC